MHQFSQIFTKIRLNHHLDINFLILTSSYLLFFNYNIFIFTENSIQNTDFRLFPYILFQP